VASGAIDTAIIVAVDSLLDYETLAWLELCGRLKHASRPVGLMPGEAAVVLMLKSKTAARALGLSVFGQIRAVATADEPTPLFAGGRSTGRGTASAIEALRPYAGFDKHTTPWLVVLHTGEDYRAFDWGMAQVHLTQASPIYQRVNTSFPVESFGCTDAAGGAVALCVTLRAFVRDYAPHEVAVIACANDSAGRAAIMVAAEDDDED
jgi:3-oxoacyl-[acyl-carrier-protein] synthase-1